jgi:LmbE family N-acetylglucosaminyl deacetylase
MNRFSPYLLSILCLGIALPVMAQEQEGRTLLAVFAHADDEWVIGPLLARYAREGADVYLAIVTRGEKWAPQTDLAPGDEIAAVRAEEARCAAEALGIHPPVQFSFDDGSLGQRVTPPWTTLSRVEEELGALFAQLRPDVVITWGPDGGYGHTEHRLVGAVVTKLVQQGVEGAPEHLLYPGIPSDRASDDSGLPWQGTLMKYLTVRVPYTNADLLAAGAAFVCYESQFAATERQFAAMYLDRAFLRGEVFLRPWFGIATGDDVFALQSGEDE